MTLGYGASRYGMGGQIWDDSRDLSPYLHKQEKLWSNKLGNLMFDTCREELKGPGRMLTLFENIAEKHNSQDQHIAWNTPITNFPVVQNYRKTVTGRTWLSYGERRIHVVVESFDETTLDTNAQKLGLSPNVVHSLDATHMAMTIAQAPYDVSPVHDSFGCVAGNMAHLFDLVRETFVELYSVDPLYQILEQLDCLEFLPNRGTLDIREVLKSDFAFA